MMDVMLASMSTSSMYFCRWYSRSRSIRYTWNSPLPAPDTDPAHHYIITSSHHNNFTHQIITYHSKAVEPWLLKLNSLIFGGDLGRSGTTNDSAVAYIPSVAHVALCVVWCGVVWCGVVWCGEQS